MAGIPGFAGRRRAEFGAGWKSPRENSKIASPGRFGDGSGRRDGDGGSMEGGRLDPLEARGRIREAGERLET